MKTVNETETIMNHRKTFKDMRKHISTSQFTCSNTHTSTHTDILILLVLTVARKQAKQEITKMSNNKVL